MHLTHPPALQPSLLPQVKPAKNLRRSKIAVEQGNSQSAIAEINAYIAVRDDLLSVAEAAPTSARIDSVEIANDVVGSCLRPSRSVYHAQHLPETDASRERQRCEQVKQRLNALRAQIK